MRLGFVADIHHHFQVVDQILESVGALDLLVIGGDLTNRGTPQEVCSALQRWQSRVPQLLAVTGNMDTHAIEQAISDLGLSLHGRGIRLGEIGFFGVSAGPFSPLNSPYELSEEEIAHQLDQGFRTVAEARVHVLVTHAPPWNTPLDYTWHGTHAGSRAVREFILQHHPQLVLCGHIHEARGQAYLGKSLVINPGPARAHHYLVVRIEEEVVIEQMN